MTFTIRYNKTGKEIVVSNSSGYIMMGSLQLKALGFKSREMFDDGDDEKKKIFRRAILKDDDNKS